MTDSARSPCVRCGSPLHTGEGRIIVAFSVLELEELAFATRDVRVRERLLAARLPPATPVAIIENGTLPGQRTTVGTLADIAERARRRSVGNPAVVVVGDVAALADVLA